MTRLTTVAGVAVLALFAGCSGTPPGEFIIIQNQVPNADCTIPATVGSLYRGEGTLDVRLIGDGPGGYQLFPLLQNNFPGPSGGMITDANRIALSGFDVEIDVPDGAPPGDITTLIRSYRSADPTDPANANFDTPTLQRHQALVEYSTLTSGSVAAGGGDTASGVNVFPGELAQTIRNLGVLSTTNRYTVMVSARARGETLVSSVRSDAFKYPIELCDGCLIFSQGTCPVAAAMGNSCNVGQDEGTGCCTIAGSLVCPATVATK
jgi:hypothetical protein